MRLRTKKGQSILEYTLLLGAIIAVIVLILLGAPGGGNIKDKVQAAYGKFGDAVSNTTADLTGGVFK